MFRFALVFALALLGFCSGSFSVRADDGPSIAITSPDQGTTFALGDIKSHTLFWDKDSKMLMAQVTFIDNHQNDAQAKEDIHQFRLPGITFDEAKGIFFATSADGVLIPVAQVKKALFFRAVVTTPNARIRILHPRGNLTVVLEAMRPDDPALHQKPSDSDSGLKVDVDNILH